MKILILVTILLSGCVQPRHETDVVHVDTSYYTDTETEDIVEKIQVFDSCGDWECRPTTLSTCLDENTIIMSLDYCTVEQFYCYCNNDTFLTYPAAEPIHCEEGCKVNHIGQDVCREWPTSHLVYENEIDWDSYEPEKWWTELEDAQGDL